MIPAARVAAAIEILDQLLEGQPVERVLTHWARRNRYAGSKDRAAIRDHVFGALRCKRSFAALGGAMTGRGIMIGATKSQDIDINSVFSGVGHAPEPLTPDEFSYVPDIQDAAVTLDCQDWILPYFEHALGGDHAQTLRVLQSRAPVYLRVNLSRTTRADAQALLASDSIKTVPHSQVNTALEVVENPRKVALSEAYLEGFVELQDASSQAIVLELPTKGVNSVLDYCSGGGGKALAMFDRMNHKIEAYDLDAVRMSDLPNRAERNQADVEICEQDQLGKYDLVLCDAPCSGSGTWRRDPQGKWSLSAERLEELTKIQRDVISSAKEHLNPGGCLAYATCSVFDEENSDQRQWVCDTFKDLSLEHEVRLSPSHLGDGFYLACFRRLK